MSSLGRKTIFYLFAGIFLLLVPAVLLYGQGYRLNFQERSVEETGSLFVETNPKRATVYVNGDSVNDPTPVLINDFLPDDYEVSVELDGYQSWSQLATIDATKSVVYGAVELFLQDPIITEITTNIETMTPSPYGSYLFITESDSFGVFDTNSDTFLWNNALTEPFTFVEWSPFEQYALIEIAGETQIISTATGHKTNLSIKFPQLISAHLLGDSEVVLTFSNEIQIYDFDRGLTIDRTPVSRSLDAWMNESGIWVLQQGMEGNRVMLIADEELQISDQLFSSDVDSFSIDQGLIILKNEIAKKSWLVAEYFGIAFTEIDGVLKMVDVQGDRLITTAHQISASDTQGNNERAVIRQSAPITQALWYFDTGYVIYLSEGSIHTDDSRYSPWTNNITLTNGDVSAFALDQEQGNVYILQNSTLKRLEIQ